MKSKVCILVSGVLLLCEGCKAKNTSVDSDSVISPEPTEIVEETPKADFAKEVSGTYLITSYDSGSDVHETFDPGNDDSIIGSSSIVLNKDGSCEFNMPGVGEDATCAWNDTEIHAAGAVIPFTVDGTKLTVTEDDEVYSFERAAE
jgi:hypothetical protein